MTIYHDRRGGQTLYSPIPRPACGAIAAEVHGAGGCRDDGAGRDQRTQEIIRLRVGVRDCLAAEARNGRLRAGPLRRRRPRVPGMIGQSAMESGRVAPLSLHGQEPMPEKEEGVD